MDKLNNSHSTIKFTVEYSLESINFLDTIVNLTMEGLLWTDLYTKDTDTHDYLLHQSAHPSHCKKSPPYSQFLRVRRICSRQVDVIRHSLILFCHFLCRGYPSKTLKEFLIRVCKTDWATLLEYESTKPTTKDNLLFFIMTYTPGFTAPWEIVLKKIGIY